MVSVIQSDAGPLFSWAVGERGRRIFAEFQVQLRLQQADRGRVGILRLDGTGHGVRSAERAAAADYSGDRFELQPELGIQFWGRRRRNAEHRSSAGEDDTWVPF